MRVFHARRAGGGKYTASSISRIIGGSMDDLKFISTQFSYPVGPDFLI